MDPISVTNDLFQTLQSAGHRLYGLFIQEGWDLVSVLGLIMLSWYTLIWILEGEMPSYFVNVLSMLVRVGVVAFMLTTWTGTTREFFVGNMQTVASHVAGEHTDAGKLLKTLWSGVHTIFSGERQKAATNCRMVPNVTPEGQVIPGSQRQVCHDPSPSAQSGAGSWTLLLRLPLTLPYVLFSFAVKLLACLALVVMAFAFVVVINLGSTLLAISFCLGPILIPWLVFPPVDFLFNSWLRFTIIAGLYKIIAWVLMTMMVQGALPKIQEVVQMASNTNPPMTDDLANHLISILTLAFVATVGAFFMWQAPNIATQLVTGAGNTGTKGFGTGLIGRGFKSLGPR